MPVLAGTAAALFLLSFLIARPALREARRHAPHVYDPENARMKA